jgi:hypothetical protein
MSVDERLLVVQIFPSFSPASSLLFHSRPIASFAGKNTMTVRLSMHPARVRGQFQAGVLKKC